jgi:hypothetical protein
MPKSFANLIKNGRANQEIQDSAELRIRTRDHPVLHIMDGIPGSVADEGEGPPAIRPRERHGGTIGNPGEGLLEQFQLSCSRQGLSAAVRP